MPAELATIVDFIQRRVDIGGQRPVSRLRRLLTATGTVVFVGGEGGDAWTGGIGRQLGAVLRSVFSRQRLVTFISRENSTDLTTLAGLMEDGLLRPAIDRTCPLTGIPDAMRDLEAGRVRGKVVVTVASQTLAKALCGFSSTPS